MTVRHSIPSKVSFVAGCILAAILAACGGGGSGGGSPVPNTATQPPLNSGSNSATPPTVTMVSYPIPSGEEILDPVTAIDPTNDSFVFNSSTALRRFTNGAFSIIPLVPYPNPPPTYVALGTDGGADVDKNGSVYAVEGYVDSDPTNCSPEACTFSFVAVTPRTGASVFLVDSQMVFSPLIVDAAIDEKNRYWALFNNAFEFNSPTAEIIDLSKPAGSQVTVNGAVGPPPPPTGSSIGTAMTRGTNITWVATTQTGDYLSKINETGTVRSFRIATNSNVQGLAMDRSGFVWFTDTGHNKIGRMAPGGSYVEYNLASNAAPTRITLGGDGAMWFIEPPRNALARIDASGHVDEFTLPASGGGPVGISGPGNLPGCNPNVLYVAETLAVVKVTEK